MNTEFGNMTLYFGVMTGILAVSSTIHFGLYFRFKKRLLQAKKQIEIRDLRKNCDRHLGIGWLGTLLTCILAGLTIASLCA
ncbi:MAG: hypothetical protein IKH07_01675 [Oscillospiraceae bacterium]|nr:hypothetical protein [Oscillospiraceae bacterium]